MNLLQSNRKKVINIDHVFISKIKSKKNHIYYRILKHYSISEGGFLRRLIDDL
jgi:hypothetical protein